MMEVGTTKAATGEIAALFVTPQLVDRIVGSPRNLIAIDTHTDPTNAADIDQLEIDVAAKANSTDVYTKTESDTNFVAVAGDTMSGALVLCRE